MLTTLKNAFKIKEIRMRLLFVLGCIVLIRLGSLIFAPGINQEALGGWMSSLNLGFLDTLTGGSFSQMSIFALGVSPYINASIIMQLLGIAIPAIEELQKDGEDGRQKLNNITRYIAVGLAVIESAALAISFGNKGILNSGTASFKEIAMVIVAFVAASCFLMWLGEKITEKGVGNGISIILLVNIVARLPQDLYILADKCLQADSLIMKIISSVIAVALIVALVVFIIILQDAERRIPVQYTKKIVGRKQAGGASSAIPLKVNTSGVIPVIFAMSILQAPIIISSIVGVTGKRVGASFWEKCLYMFDQSNWFNFTGDGEFKYTVGAIIYIALIIFFAFYYTAVTFNPVEISNNLKKQGGFIPGIRPGKPTADYLTKILNRIIFIGAVMLSIAAIAPMILSGAFSVKVSFAATSIIIVVGVVLETVKQVESLMAVRHYKGFLDK